MPTPPLTDQFSARQLTLDPAELITYEVDAGMDRGKPDGVFFPETTADVSRIVQWAAATQTPLIARGAGTGLAGGAVAEHGGILVALARMNQVTSLEVAARTATVQVGVANLAFDTLTRQHGLYYPPDPSSGRASVMGGNIGANAGGPHCFKYGVTTNYVTGVEAVLADGRVVQLGHAAADAPGYDLLGAVVGSEGTLAIVTHAQVRLLRAAPAVKTMMVAFASEEEAGEAVSAVIAAGLTPATLEMMDQRIMRMIEAYAPVGLPIDAGAGLIVEVDGYPAGLDAQMGEIAEILSEHGGFDLRLAQNEAERAQIWYGRKSAAGAVSRLAPAFYLVDVTVPRSKLAPMLAGVNEICQQYELAVGHVFHAGDGNLHPIIPFDPRDADQRGRVLAACEAIVARCLAYDGSITGEHGVGIEKRAYMPMMYGGAELAAMLDVKRVFDPDNLLNPGKIFPAELPAPVYAEPIYAESTELDTSDPEAITLTPDSAEQAAGLLAGLSASRRSVRIGSAQTGDCRGAQVWLSTARLAGIHTLAPADLYVTAGAGTQLAELQEALAAHNMIVPVFSPWPQATLGGLLAMNFNAPSRLRYGSLRDNVLALTVALADGRVLRLGRPVVKNVAGYDLVKLFIGAYGTLGLMTDVTLKLLPQPRARRAYTLDAPTPAAGLAWAAATARRWLMTSAVTLVPGADSGAACTLHLTVEGLAPELDAESDELRSALDDAGAPAWDEHTDDTDRDATAAWSAFLRAGDASGTLIRVGVPSMQLGKFWAQLPPHVQHELDWCFDAGNHLAYVYLASEPAAQQDQLREIRAAAVTVGGYAVVTDMAATGLGEMERWGMTPPRSPDAEIEIADTRELMAALKARWDPQAILNPGDHPAA